MNLSLKRAWRLLWALALGSFSSQLFAQDLDSELELKPRTRWVLESGVEPAILECRVADRGHIQCVSSSSLLHVECEGMHYGRRTQLKASFKGRAFSCEGTRYDKDSLFSQWRVRLKAEKGSEAVWIVDAANSEQLRRLYTLELRSLEKHPKVRELLFSLSLLGRVENVGAQGHQAGALRLELGRSPVFFDFDFTKLLRSGVENPSRVRLGFGVVLGSQDAGRGWLLKANTGHSVLPLKADRFVRAWSHCIGSEYRWNPLSWSFRVGGANCWFQRAKVSFAPQGHLAVAYQISAPFYLTGEISAGLPQGEYSGYSISGPQVQGQLGVSITLLPD